jgi:hypothetical protein
MFTFLLPLLLNLLIIFYCIFNVKTKYNIIYIVWGLLSFAPILSYFVLLVFTIMFTIGHDQDYEPLAQPKSTKLNKFLFGYEERKD